MPPNKSEIRQQAHAARRALTNRDEFSARILDRVFALPEYARAATVMFYLDVRAEVRTRPALPAALASGKTLVVPWCNDHGELELFHLESMDELEPGSYGILEPRAELRNRRQKQITPEQLDLILVPGVAFDRRGGRVGHGKGYFDKLLRHARADARLVGLAFECQLFPEVPMQEHDLFMDRVVTEAAVFAGRRLSAALRQP